MTNIRYICLSDIHLGQADSILTKLKDNIPEKREKGVSDIDWQHHSPALAALCDCLRVLVENNAVLEPKPTLILAGDAIENALAETNDSMMVFERFVELIFPNGEALFEEIIFVPGNHDHHMWELARETQYAENYLKGKKFADKLEAPWHFTKMFEQDKDSWSDLYFISNLIKRLPPPEFFRVRVAYPNMGLHSREKNRCVIFHHGHYTEDIYYLVSEFASLVDPAYVFPKLVDDVEQENFAWIDFFWSALGRSGLAGPLIGNIYIALGQEKARDKLLNNLAQGIAKQFGPKNKVLSCLIQLILKVLLKWITSKVAERERSTHKAYPIKDVLLSKKGLKTFKKYLEGPVFKQMAYEISHRWGEKRIPAKTTFVFGHTHKPFESEIRFKGYTNNVCVFNTGGWVVEETAPVADYGGAAVLVDDDLNVTSLRLYNEAESNDKYEVRVTDTDSKPNPLTQYVRELIKKDATVWKNFSQKAAQEVSRHREYLKQRISALEK